MVSTTIEAVHARRIFDSRGFPTLEAEVMLVGGARGRAAVPSGASTGAQEAWELRDGGAAFSGKDVQMAVENVNRLIGPEVVGRDALDQVGVDQAMCDLDGTPNKKRLGANAILAVSLAMARAAAAAGGVPLYRYLGGPTARILPVPLLNLVNGGAHASNGLEIQEFMVVPAGYPTFGEALVAGVEIYHALKTILRSEGRSVNVGDEGGFAPDLPSNRAALEALCKAVDKAGCQMGRDVGLALDVAASEMYQKGRYLIEGRQLESAGMVEYLVGLVEDYGLVSVEDGLAEDDWEGWEMLTRGSGRAHPVGWRRSVRHQRVDLGRGDQERDRQLHPHQGEPDRFSLRDPEHHGEGRPLRIHQGDQPSLPVKPRIPSSPIWRWARAQARSRPGRRPARRELQIQ